MNCSHRVAALILLALIVIATCGCTSTSPAAGMQTAAPGSTVAPAGTGVSSPGEMKTIGVIGGVSWESSIE